MAIDLNYPLWTFVRYIEMCTMQVWLYINTLTNDNETSTDQRKRNLNCVGAYCPPRR